MSLRRTVSYDRLSTRPNSTIWSASPPVADNVQWSWPSGAGEQAGAIRWASALSSSLRNRLAWTRSCNTPSKPAAPYRRLTRYTIRLTTEEREQLNRLIRGGKHAARIVTRARILIKIDEGWTVPQIAAAPVSSTGPALDVSEGTVYAVKRRYAAEGLDGVCTTGSRPTVSANWTRRRRPISLLWRAAMPHRATTTGRCSCWPTG